MLSMPTPLSAQGWTGEGRQRQGETGQIQGVLGQRGVQNRVGREGEELARGTLNVRCLMIVNSQELVSHLEGPALFRENPPELIWQAPLADPA